jgi:hypothetical protein
MQKNGDHASTTYEVPKVVNYGSWESRTKDPSPPPPPNKTTSLEADNSTKQY